MFLQHYCTLGTNLRHKTYNCKQHVQVRGDRALKIDADTSVGVRVRRGVAALAPYVSVASCVWPCGKTSDVLNEVIFSEKWQDKFHGVTK